VARTFALSYDRLDPVDATDAYARGLLACAAHFASGQPIPRELLLATVAWAPEAPNGALQADDALRRLLNLGLLESDVTGAVRLHRLLAVFVRGASQDIKAPTAVEDALLATAERIHNTGYPGPLLALHPHLRAVTEAAQLRADERTASLATALGRSLYELGDYRGAEPCYLRALAIRQHVLRPDHLDLATSFGHLALLYKTQGRYAEAEPLYQRVLAIREQGLGGDHADMAVAQTMNNLAELYRVQGRYAEAEPLYQRALAIRERVFGPKHPDVAMVRKSYAAFPRATNAQSRLSSSKPKRLKVGRNAPCPCGSGKKYKRCHGK
jgi:tetratricopeptide (TPR) repeat protein